MSSELASLIEANTRIDGAFPTPIPGLHLSRYSSPMHTGHGVQCPTLAIVAQGTKELMLGNEAFTYAPGHCLVVSLDLPVSGRVTTASKVKPYLGMRLDLDVKQIPSLRTSGKIQRATKPDHGVFLSRMTPELLDPVLRLLRLLGKPEDSAVLAPLLQREILYRLLRGEQGEQLERMAQSDGNASGVVKAVVRLKENFDKPFSIKSIAEETNMSPSGLHHQFKTLTNMTPFNIKSTFACGRHDGSCWLRRWMRLLRGITLAIRAAHSSPVNTAVSSEPRHFGMWSRPANSLSQQNCEDGCGSRARYPKKSRLICSTSSFVTVSNRPSEEVAEDASRLEPREEPSSLLEAVIAQGRYGVLHYHKDRKEEEGSMAVTETPMRTMRSIQQSLPLAVLPVPPLLLESKGAVYTKRWVVELLLDLAAYIPESNLVDALAVEPAAGDGAFLGPMIERLADSCRRLGRPLTDCADSLIAYELDEKSAERARTLAVEVLRQQGAEWKTATSLAQIWVRTGDYLFDSMHVEADFVIGNPPYVRLEDIPEETAQLYRHVFPTMRGRADLYVAFFEAALQQLRDNGTCAFICADRWMRNQYGAELRKMITSEFSVDVVLEMHQADAFEDEVDAYPAITVIRRKQQGQTIVASSGPEVAGLPSGALAMQLLGNGTAVRATASLGLHRTHVDSWFQGADPWPCQSPEQLALLRRLEEAFPALEAHAKVGIGVATGNDKVFVTKHADLVEPSRLLKLALASDIRGGTMRWSGHYLVDPWNNTGLVTLNDYPRMRDYFEKHEAALKERHTALKSKRAWYKTIDRVTHSLTDKPKLYIADIKNILDPVLDSGETYPHHNLYFIQSDVWDLEVLGGLLISAISQFFVASYGVRMRGGYFRFQAQYLRRIRVPDPKTLSKTQAKALVKAFRNRDRQLATQTALTIYGIEESEMESAIGH